MTFRIACFAGVPVLVLPLMPKNTPIDKNYVLDKLPALRVSEAVEKRLYRRPVRTHCRFEHF